jgi:hypothetical protein
MHKTKDDLKSKKNRRKVEKKSTPNRKLSNKLIEFKSENV